MKPLSGIDMMEVMRLTRRGRLNEAMAMLGGTGRKSGSGAAAEDRAATPRPRAAPSAFPAGLAERWRRMADAGAVRRTGAEPASPHDVPVPAGARFETRLFANTAGTRDYKLYVPSKPAGRALPLVVMLHGCTQSPDDFAAGTRMNELAEEFGFLVVYPAQSKAANSSKCWNWFSAADQERERGEPSLIAGITREVIAEFGVDPKRVYVAGLSAGGAQAAIMGATYPDLFAAVGVHSGLACGAARDVASAFAAMSKGGAPSTGRGTGIPTIAFHGDGDATVNKVNGEHVIAQAKAGDDFIAEREKGRSPGGVSYTRTRYRDGRGRALHEHWLLHGAGHAWAGGSSAGSYTDPGGPDASREMLRFFLEQDGPSR
ncbi:PHB depolymerase family esterase [Aurantimonas sp. HBX-1]|uniref:extracellular catalytic domain type 1 short-chain-length polyhydroxyalkanoate depolymerase n=1 Tax=Aurantimonas sp. HBX-1 TaxID=2906072 RepID=UPI001F45BC15|nr:PHB depolymerase family esterase [Aurantimonas sp. HBX-1]UIJ70449.1 PHB depolymerase family esterase [Aurantimonas sp. HBX-1]